MTSDWGRSEPVSCPGNSIHFLFPVVRQRSDERFGTGGEVRDRMLGMMMSFAGVVVSGLPLTVPSFGFAAV